MLLFLPLQAPSSIFLFFMILPLQTLSGIFLFFMILPLQTPGSLLAGELCLQSIIVIVLEAGTPGVLSLGVGVDRGHTIVFLVLLEGTFTPVVRVHVTVLPSVPIIVAVHTGSTPR